MHLREYLRTDLREKNATVCGEDAADTLTKTTLERDSKADYLLGLQHNCVRVLYWTRATETISDEPLTTGRTDRTKTVETHPKTDREDVLAFVADEEWAWLHPRYRWVTNARQ